MLVKVSKLVNQRLQCNSLRIIYFERHFLILACLVCLCKQQLILMGTLLPLMPIRSPPPLPPHLHPLQYFPASMLHIILNPAWSIDDNRSSETNRSIDNHKLGWCPYYDDEKWKRFYYLLFHLLFFLEILGLYLDFLTYLYVVTSIRAIMCLVGSVYFLLVLTRVLRLLFASFMFASINLVSFLYDGNEHFLAMDCQ